MPTRRIESASISCDQREGAFGSRTREAGLPVQTSDIAWVTEEELSVTPLRQLMIEEIAAPQLRRNNHLFLCKWC